MKRDVFFLIIGIICLGVMSHSSFNGRQTVAQVCSYAIDISGEPDNAFYEDMMRVHALEELEARKKTLINKRNPFEAYVAPQPAPKRPVLALPSPREKEKVAPIVEPQKKIERYSYRGTMMLNDKKAYVIERESDRKMFFVNKNDRVENMVVLETNDKQVIIADDEKTIFVLERFQ